MNKDQENSAIKKEMKTLSKEPHILFVNTQSKYSELVKQAALKSNQSYINDRWIGGTLTNWKQISESILLYNKFSIQFERFLMINNIQIPLYQKAKKRYEGLKLSKDNKPSKYIPDIIILTNPDQNNIVIKEAQLFKIPVIAFADSNTKTFGIDYIIPGNNKSIYFMYFCLNLITITLQKTKKRIL
jgi:small subunit ribosomal protein S2